jgi:hypothetical protein
MKITKEDIGKIVYIVGGIRGKIGPGMFGSGEFNITSSKEIESVNSDGTTCPRGEPYVLSYAVTFGTELADLLHRSKLCKGVSVEVTVEYAEDSIRALRAAMKRMRRVGLRDTKQRTPSMRTAFDSKLSKLLLKHEIFSGFDVSSEVLGQYVADTIQTFIRTMRILNARNNNS